MTLAPSASCHAPGHRKATIVILLLCLLSYAKPGSGQHDFRLTNITGSDDATQMAGGLAVDIHNNIIYGGMFKGSLEIGNVSVVSKGQNDVFVVKNRPEGNLEWVRSFGSGDDEDLRSI